MEQPLMIIPTVNPRNRHEWRSLASEMQRIDRHMQPIENEFIEWLFESDEQDPYDPNYEAFLEQFQKMSELVETWVKPKLCRINKEYFYQLYYPIENENKP